MLTIDLAEKEDSLACKYGNLYFECGKSEVVLTERKRVSANYHQMLTVVSVTK